MTSFELLKLLGNAQDEYIMDSRKRPKQPQKPPILKLAALAACAAILIGLGGTVLYVKPWTFCAHKCAGNPILPCPRCRE